MVDGVAEADESMIDEDGFQPETGPEPDDGCEGWEGCDGCAERVEWEGYKGVWVRVGAGRTELETRGGGSK